MYVDVVPNRNSPPAVLLRESYREGKRVRKRTLANLSALPEAAIEAVRRTLKGEALVPAEEHFEILRARPHGHVAAVVGTMRKLGVPELLSSRSHRKRQLVLAMIAARVIEPCSKLAMARALDRETLASSLGEAVGVEGADADDLYDALDWLGRGQGRIEKKLGRRHLEEGQLILWDVSPVPFESRTCELAAYGRSRGGKKSTLQLLFGLLTTPEGLPVAVEVFPGNTGDPSTVASALERLTERFALRRVVMVGDRGMLTQARITEDLQPRGVDWITSLRAPTIRKLLRDGPLQLSLFDQQDLAQITSPDFPGERLIACRNPLLAQDRARKREELLEATERELQQVVRATRREKRPLRGQDKIGIRVGKVLGTSKVAKHFTYEITEEAFTFERDTDAIAEEAALDGIYVIRTSVSDEALGAEEVVRAYKRLSEVERAFRICKDFALAVEPIYHRREDRVRAHVFLCMLALYVRQHMEQALAPILFTDHDPDGAEARQTSIVAPAIRSEAAEQKIRRKRTPDGLPVHSFRSLLQDLATLTKNTVRVGETPVRFEQYARPTQLQARAFQLLDLSYRL
ncbi:MAG: IS1634 family transposase [Thermoanaerobaculia bacterium]